jgi:hypothetical protein
MNDDQIDLLDALRALAFMGDLSMGQPVDHSPVGLQKPRSGDAQGLCARTALTGPTGRLRLAGL